MGALREDSACHPSPVFPPGKPSSITPAPPGPAPAVGATGFPASQKEDPGELHLVECVKVARVNVVGETLALRANIRPAEITKMPIARTNPFFIFSPQSQKTIGPERPHLCRQRRILWRECSGHNQSPPDRNSIKYSISLVAWLVKGRVSRQSASEPAS